MKYLSLWYSVRHAARGAMYAFRVEKNIRLHTIAAGIVIVSGFFFELSRGEWVGILLAIGLVFTLELLNSAVESLIDITNPRLSEPIARVKDMLAAAVLLASFIALGVGLVTFIPHTFSLFL